jgi:hypothetical protein
MYWEPTFKNNLGVASVASFYHSYGYKNFKEKEGICYYKTEINLKIILMLLYWILVIFGKMNTINFY